uniref:Si:ch73-252i11.1 n=1 Tax=Amphilophus citrinellus TaxID=61819 RepID=A0A3Q0RIQ6_AMPCI
METEIVKIICANQGAVNTDDLLYNLFPGDPSKVSEIICNREKFASWCPNGQPKVVARTRLRLCRVKDCPQTCRDLHLCKNFLFSGFCQFTHRRGGCCFSHDLTSDYNQRLLREHELESLSREELCTLLLQSDNALLPEICYDYNNGDGEFGRCKDGDGCKRLHICKKYMRRECSCSKNHDFNAPQPLKTLQARHVPGTLLLSLKALYTNKEALRLATSKGGRVNRGNSSSGEVSTCGNNTTASREDGESLSEVKTAAANTSCVKCCLFLSDKTEICMYFIKGQCIHEDRCFKAHDKMPYRWEVQQGGQWTALEENETIERDYCNPSKSYSSTSPAVHFDTMTCGPNKVRRLSTENSVIEPTFIHTTEWLWYWEDEYGRWNVYLSNTGGHEAANINSTKLEEKFLTNDKDVEFTVGSQSYSLSFQDMIQTNKHYGTKRLVCRRPRFVSAADVLTKKVRRPLLHTSAPIPDNWDKTQIPQTGYSRVSLQRSSAEFTEVEALFCKTMRGFDIVGIERIQNKALWEAFQLQKNQMKSKTRGGNVTEKQLFHGTDSRFVDAICHHNFDWRICGTHGTAFGKGSYFARDARYSHDYTGDTDVRAMFISRVLVGDYTRGSSDYVRPPSKDGGDINFYDSCVDDVMNPSIFVVFEKHQICPEYLLQYRTMYSGGAASPPNPSVFGGGAAPAAASQSTTDSCVIA